MNTRPDMPQTSENNMGTPRPSPLPQINQSAILTPYAPNLHATYNLHIPEPLPSSISEAPARRYILNYIRKRGSNDERNCNT